MKHAYKIYLETEDYKFLIEKAKQCSFSGRGALSYFLSFIAKNEILFLDQNLKKMLKALNLS